MMKVQKSNIYIYICICEEVKSVDYQIENACDRYTVTCKVVRVTNKTGSSSDD
jgi:hypothetical protein